MFINSVSKKLRFLTDDSQYSLFTTRDILRLVIPLFFEQLLFRLVGSADTLMVAGLGEASISAVSLVDMFNNCTSSIIIALATVVATFPGWEAFILVPMQTIYFPKQNHALSA